MKHKHSALIKAWADGAPIQYYSLLGIWIDIDNPSWGDEYQYRIRPKKQIGDFPKHILPAISLKTNETGKKVKVLEASYTDSDLTTDYVLGIVRNYEGRDLVVEINPKNGTMFNMNGRVLEEHAIVDEE